jgi:DNA-directed RNA polymerase subunit RPC12/RpoP
MIWPADKRPHVSLGVIWDLIARGPLRAFGFEVGCGGCTASKKWFQDLSIGGMADGSIAGKHGDGEWYFVCSQCGAKWFAAAKRSKCPRCGRTSVSRERLVPPWRKTPRDAV